MPPGGRRKKQKTDETDEWTVGIRKSKDKVKWEMNGKLEDKEQVHATWENEKEK